MHNLDTTKMEKKAFEIAVVFEGLPMINFGKTECSGVSICCLFMSSFCTELL